MTLKFTRERDWRPPRNKSELILFLKERIAYLLVSQNSRQSKCQMTERNIALNLKLLKDAVSEQYANVI